MTPVFKLLVILMALHFPSFGQQLNIYPTPAEGFDHQSAIYKIEVKQGSVKKESYVYASHADTNMSRREWGGQQGKSFHYTIFSFDGPVTIYVTKKNSPAKSATIRPAKIGLGTIAANTQDNNSSVSFRLSKPGKFSVEFDDDPRNREALMIFADSLEKSTNVPDINSSQVWLANTADKNMVVPAGKSILYFAPGIYEPGRMEIPAYVKQIYLAGGAFVRAYIYANRDNDAPLKINGRGILSNDPWPYHYPVNTPDEADYKKWYRMIDIQGGHHHYIEGITLVDGTSFVISTHSSHHCIVDNININGFRYNNDGVGLPGDNNGIYNSFFRLNEDVTGFNGNNSTIKNCSFWLLHNGSIIQLGWTPHNIGGNNLIEDCYILHGEWDNDQVPNCGFINAMNMTTPWMTPKGGYVVENFTIRNIYFDTEILRCIDLRMLRNGKGQPSTIRNFTFDNIHLVRNKLTTPLFYFTGYDADHTISNMSFSKIYVNDKLIDESSKESTDLFRVENFANAPIFKK